ncbi:MAG: exodeoxyribonuclease V subunit gamma [Acetatifactor sp.]|nr:exodeoxyribonuclease V subunit gamma [Acetatifactor sp.]
MERAGREPGRNFLFIVPDQYTMQTQKDLVSNSDCSGIMNIDVLSFGRLSHRILEEVGGEDTTVLDDTGKSLVLQKVALSVSDELPTLKGLIKKQGYIHEVKSVLSEFMQYGIGVDDVDRLIEYSKGRNALNAKLKDLKVIYKAFKDYIRDSFITTEEKMDVLTRAVSKSGILKNSVVIFDGFTGFTPIQYRVLTELMMTCSEVVISLTLGMGEDPYVLDGEHNLFYLTKKTVADLEKCLQKAGGNRGSDVFVNSDFNRFKDSKELGFLEQNIFRSKSKRFEEIPKDIQIFEATDPAEEVGKAAVKIKKLIMEEGISYRDIAVVSGSLEDYAPYIETRFELLDIPFYIDRTRGIRLNPLIETIKAYINLFLDNFTYEAVFSFLRGGMSDFETQTVDELENYCIATGIRGISSWKKVFSYETMDVKDEEKKAFINEAREKFVTLFDGVALKPSATAAEYTENLYDFLTKLGAGEKLNAFSEDFKASGDPVKAKEYSQIYRVVMEMLDQIHELLKDEVISLREFSEIIDAGIAEITVGTIPQNVDRCLVGDVERSRLNNVKVLFFLGVNDGNIPKGITTGGLISDADREFLRDSDLELAPTPRQQMFIQRLYLYMNMTKPSRKLFLSYSRVNSEGKSLAPSYLIKNLCGLYPELRISEDNGDILGSIINKKQGQRYLAEGLREYFAGLMTPEKAKDFKVLYSVYKGSDLSEEYTRAALSSYEKKNLSKAVASALYGLRLENSVTRLENFASCAYMHFLEYGLSLKEREKYGFDALDLGNVFHGVLQMFSIGLERDGKTWLNFDETYAKEAVSKAVDDFCADYNNTVFYASAQNAYAIIRMKRILTRSVMTLQNQIAAGDFVPKGYEVSFGRIDDPTKIDVTLSDTEKMYLKGKIDRIDTCRDEDHIYVKVLDYKSGNKDFDLVALYHGLSLQLVLYMKAATGMLEKENPGAKVVPAAWLYYRVDDPQVTSAEALTDEEINEKIQKALRTKGLVNGDDKVLYHLDKAEEGESVVIPVKYNKDHSLAAASDVIGPEDMLAISGYTDLVIKRLGKSIVDGDISISPSEKKQGRNACEYCAFKSACPMDKNIPGYEYRDCSKVENCENDADILDKMRKEIDEVYT